MLKSKAELDKYVLDRLQKRNTNSLAKAIKTVSQGRKYPPLSLPKLR